MHNNLGRDELLKRLSILDFMLLDLGLYLDVVPDDARALAIFSRVSEDAEELRKSYETTYAPLIMRHQTSAGDSWKWIADPWPWEAEANFQI